MAQTNMRLCLGYQYMLLVSLMQPAHLLKHSRWIVPQMETCLQHWIMWQIAQRRRRYSAAF